MDSSSRRYILSYDIDDVSCVAFGSPGKSRYRRRSSLVHECTGNVRPIVRSRLVYGLMRLLHLKRCRKA